MSVEEERAALLRAIASGGFSPYLDSDGSTANTLYGWAEELAPTCSQNGNARTQFGNTHRKRGFLYRSARRVYLRLKLRAKLRWLGLVPMLSVCWATVEVRALTAQPHDSLHALPAARAALGEWQPQWRVWCLTRHADFGSLFVIVAVSHPDTATQCTRPEGGSYPLVVDLPECPRGELVPTAAPFMITRCDNTGWQRFPSKRPAPRTI
jgi:hypothetical protein